MPDLIPNPRQPFLDSAQPLARHFVRSLGDEVAA
jgi:hypothetical protein